MSVTFLIMKGLKPVDKFLGVLLIGFVIFIAGWLYGNQDFFTRGFGTCSNAWNPQPVISDYTKQYSPNLKFGDCSEAAEARREQIFFVGFISFVLLSVGFLAISNSQGNKVEV
jgi:hypothetical protein